jgi:hypothetical protein
MYAGAGSTSTPSTPGGLTDRASGELQPTVGPQHTRHPTERATRRVDDQADPQPRQHARRARRDRQGPAHHQPGERVDEQRHPRCVRPPGPWGQHQHGQLDMVGLPPLVALLGLPAQVDAVSALPLDAIGGRGPLDRPQLTRDGRLERAQRRHRRTGCPTRPPGRRSVPSARDVGIDLGLGQPVRGSAQAPSWRAVGRPAPHRAFPDAELGGHAPDFHRGQLVGGAQLGQPGGQQRPRLGR